MKPTAPSLLAAVALGGAIGSVTRYLVGVAIQPKLAPDAFPTATLLINVTGSLLLGFLLEALLMREVAGGGLTPAWRLALTTGFCGGYTTFSTFSVETARLIESGEPRRAAVYVLASAIGSVIAAMLGLGAARSLMTR